MFFFFCEQNCDLLRDWEGLHLTISLSCFFLERLVHSNLIPQFVPSLPKLLTWVVWEWSERKTLALESSINEAVRWKYQESQISLTDGVKKKLFSGTYFNRFCVCGEKHWGVKKYGTMSYDRSDTRWIYYRNSISSGIGIDPMSTLRRKCFLDPA